jgi:hypothetical protein
MTKRNGAVVMPLVVVTTLGVASLWAVWTARDHIGLPAYAQLRLGMKKGEVNEILGPRASHLEVEGVDRITTVERKGETKGAAPTWIGPKYAIRIYFDDKERVRGLFLGIHERREITLQQKIKIWRRQHGLNAAQ